jgi:hypothetical protein
MKILTLILSILFLSAGAFAGNNAAPTSQLNGAGTTIISKNQSWPPAGLITVEPCKHFRCYDA